MSHQNAPLISKCMETQASEGYNFVLVENKDTEQRYRETVWYTDFKGLTLLHDPGSSEYTLQVGPGQSKIIILEANLKEGFSFASSISSAVELSDAMLKKLCLTEDNKAQRGEDEIYCYVLQHGAGIYFVWQNDTTHLVYTEELTFDIEGLEVIGQTN